jgi:beta-xylosidase
LKIDDVPNGFISEASLISPEVHRAQRMAELKNFSYWKGERLQKIKDWADPIKRQQMKENIAKEAELARFVAKKMEEENQEIFEIPEYRKIQDFIKISQVKKPIKPHKIKLLSKIINWFSK